jgi:transposase
MLLKKRRQQKAKAIELARLAETLKKEAPELYRQLFEDKEGKEETKENKEKLSKTLKSLGYNEADIEALKQEILKQKKGLFPYTTMQILKIIFIFIILHTLFQLAIIFFVVVPKLPLFFY